MKGTPSCPIRYFTGRAYAKGKKTEPGSETKINAIEPTPRVVTSGHYDGAASPRTEWTNLLNVRCLASRRLESRSCIFQLPDHPQKMRAHPRN